MCTVHPATMSPLLQSGIPVRVRNTFKPELPGTWIGPLREPSTRPVKGLTIAPRMALVEVCVPNGDAGIRERALAWCNDRDRSDFELPAISSA